MSGRMRPLHRALILVGVIIAACVWQQFGRAQSNDTNGPAVSADEAQGIIFEREQIMQQLDKDTAKLGKIVAGEIPPDSLPEVTQSIAQGAKDAVEAFQSKVPGGRAKPEVWSNWPDFSQRMNDFAAKSAAMAKIGQSGDLNGVTAMMLDALPCKQCHDLYREPKKNLQPVP